MVFRLKRKKRPPLASVAANAGAPPRTLQVDAAKRPRVAQALTASVAPPVAVAQRKRKSFAPPRRKVASGDAAFGSSSGSASRAQPVEEMCFEVLFCKRSSKKHKVYSDGFLVVGMGSFGKGACLYSPDGKVVRMMNHFGTSLEFLGAGSEFDCGTKEVEIVGKVSMAAFSSGTLFMGGAGVAPIAAAAPRARLKSAAFRAHRPGSGKGGARVGLGLGRGASGSASAGARSTRPPIKARHDPERADAVLIEAVSARDAAKAAADGAATSVAVVLDPGLAAKLNAHQVEAVRSMWQVRCSLLLLARFFCLLIFSFLVCFDVAVHPRAPAREPGACAGRRRLYLGARHGPRQDTLRTRSHVHSAAPSACALLRPLLLPLWLTPSQMSGRLTICAALFFLRAVLRSRLLAALPPPSPPSPPQSPTSHPLVKRCVIVTPASLVLNWKAEIKKWLPGTFARAVSAVTLKGSEGKRQVRDFVQSSAKVSSVLILGYETFRQHVDILCGAKGAKGRKKLASGGGAKGASASASSGLASLRGALLVCDEGHRLKNASGNQTTKALNRFPSHRRILVTGTPVQNKLLECVRAWRARARARLLPCARAGALHLTARTPAAHARTAHTRRYYALIQFIRPADAPLGNVEQFHNVFAKPIEKSRDRAASPRTRRIGDERSAQLSAITDAFVLRKGRGFLSESLPPRFEYVVVVRPTALQVRCSFLLFASLFFCLLILCVICSSSSTARSSATRSATARP
jgi:hypothetical protein